MQASSKRTLNKGATGCLSASATRRIATILVLLAVCGCGKSSLDRVPVHGTVTFKGKPAADGDVRFIPIEGTKGPVSVGNIVAGEYSIDARGGVPTGKHRVEIRILGAAKRPVADTGILSTSGQIVDIGPPIYNSPQSPLRAEVPGENDGEFNFEVP